MPLRGGVFLAGQMSGCGFDTLPGVDLFVLRRAEIAQCGMWATGGVDFVDEGGEMFGAIFECLKRHRMTRPTHCPVK